MSEDHNDPLRIEFLRDFLEIPVDFTSSTHLKVLCTMGDRAAISVAKLLVPSNNLDSVHRSKILYVIRSAFRRPEMIEDPKDRVPE